MTRDDVPLDDGPAVNDMTPYLRAVEAIDWTKVHVERDGEHTGDWFLVDGKVLLYGGDVEDAVIEFLKRAPVMIRQLQADYNGMADSVYHAFDLLDKQVEARAKQLSAEQGHSSEVEKRLAALDARIRELEQAANAQREYEKDVRDRGE